METRRMLVVDDEESIRQLFKDAFADNNYSVETAIDGEEALELLAKENIKVIFLDLNLPGISGIELCKKVRQFYPLAIVHAITGYNSLFELVDCRRSGFDDYFTKPLDLKQVYRATESAFNKLARWAGP